MGSPADDFREALQQFNSGRDDAARATLNRILRKAPGEGPANHLLAQIHVRQGQLDRALTAARIAASALPSDGSTRNTLGLIHLRRRDLPAAEQAFRDGVRIDPSSWQLRLGLARALLARRDFDAAATEARAAATLNPRTPGPRRVLANALLDSARADEAVTELQRARDEIPGDLEILDLLCLALHNPSGVTPAAIAAAHRDYGDAAERIAGTNSPADSFPNDRSPDRRLRIGYVSPDFRAHSVAYFIEPTLLHHDRKAVEVFCYFTSPHADDTTHRLRAAVDHWRDINPAIANELANAVRGDAIDILIELSGHTRGNSLAALARRLAPIQVSWIGYPDITGLRTIDFRPVDARTDPPGTNLPGAEQLIRLPRCFLCYAPDPAAPPVSPPPSERAGHITFASFNAAAKISAATLDLWAAVLAAVSGSRLLLKNDGMNDPNVQARVTRALSDRGIEPNRIECLGYIDRTDGHLGLYARADIALDTFPYHGTTTTCEALWMGVPVVTLAGETHHARVGASLLHALGLDDLIATDPTRYAAIVTGLARDPARLRELRSGSRDRMERSPLCDGKSMAKAVEAVYREIWRQWSTRRA